MHRQTFFFTGLLAAGLSVLVLVETASGSDWPTYGHDSQRSAISTEQMKAPLSEEWVFRPTHPPSHAWGDPQPKPVEGLLELPRLRFDDAFHVAAVGDLVYFGSSSDNKVYALDAKTGDIRWEFYTDGPVRLAPTVWKGKVYVGSDDGNVYCLDAAEGHMIWTFAAAPGRDMVLGNGKMISLWPVRTSVLVDNGVAYFGAGVFAVEGLYLYAVNAENGKLLWKNDTYGYDRRCNISPQGYLVASKDKLFVPGGRTMPAAFRRKNGRFLFHNFPPQRLFGGTYALLAGDLLFNGTEHMLAVSESNGGMVFKDAARRLIVDKDVAYLLTGHEAIAVDRKDWQDAPEKREQLNRLRERLANLRMQRKELATADAEKEKLKEALDRVIAKETNLEKQLKQATKWCVPCDCTDSMVLTRNILFVGGAGVVKGLDTATGKGLWSAKVNGKVRGMAVANGSLLASTDNGSIHCFIPGTTGLGRKGAPRIVTDPFPKDELTDFYAKTAKEIVRDSGIKRGYALILGGGEGRLALELAKRTELMIYMVEPDEKKVAKARKALTGAGVYGGQVVVMRRPLDAVPYADYCANLIVCEGSFFSGAVPTPAEEVLRMLKPCGGVAYVGRPPAANAIEKNGWLARLRAKRARKAWAKELRKKLKDSGEKSTSVVVRGGVAKVTRGPLNGAGRWTHQYAEPGNTACGDDQLVRGPLGILWFGEPGPGRMPSRHASAAAPLAIGGRMFVQGENVIMAYDAYNGLLLWERNIPGAMRLRISGGRCSNLAANDDGLFVVAGGKCLHLDPVTGRTLKTYKGHPGKDKEPAEWGQYIACVGELLYGSRGTDCIFAVDIDSGRGRWTHYGKDIMANTICIGDGRMFFVQWSVTNEQRERALKGIKKEMRLDRRGKPIPPDVRLVVALNAETGEKEWERPQYVSDCVRISRGGGDLMALYSDNVLLLCGQPWNGHFWREFFAGEFSRRSLIALAGNDGRLLWCGRKGYRSRPIIVGDRVIAEPWAHDLKTGTEKTRLHPVAGVKTKWQFSRPGHHCGSIAAAPKALFFRSSTVAYYDLEADSGTVHFGVQRPGCWINIIPANGVVMMPEASSGCVCPYPLHCTTVFYTRKKNRGWSVFSAAGNITPIKRLAVNFGAPGDRKDSNSTLWLAYPRPYSSGTPGNRLALDLTLDTQMLEGGGFFTGNANFLRIDGTDDAWIYGSGLRGLQCMSVDLEYLEQGLVSLPADRPAKIDGIHDEPLWNGYKGIPVTDGGRAWLRYDNDNLYVAYRRPRPVDENGAVRPWRMKTKGDDASVWEDDSFEVYISDTSADKCLHLGVSASGARYDASWKYVEHVFPAFDIPRLEGITIDGKANDWGRNGFEVRSLVGNRNKLRPPDDFDPSFMVGWNDKGMLLLVRVRDDFIDEYQNRAELWREDSMEIFVTPAPGSGESYQVAVGTGADPKYPETRIYFWDRRSRTAGKELTAEAAGEKTPDGYLVEVLLPWQNLKITPAIGTQVGLQLFINDSDGQGTYPGDWFRAAWHPGGHPTSNPESYHLMRLAAKPSAPIQFKRGKVSDDRGFFTAVPPYPFPLHATSIGTHGEDSKYNGTWSSAVQTVDEGAEEAFTAELAIPWAALAGAGLNKQGLIVNLNSRGLLHGAPRMGGWFRRVVLFSREKVPVRSFTVRLHFVEPDDVKPGERIFDVKVQGNIVLSDFDVVAAAGGRNRAVIREFKGIAAGRIVTLALIPKGKQPTPSSLPIISGIEIVEEVK